MIPYDGSFRANLIESGEEACTIVTCVSATSGYGLTMLPDIDGKGRAIAAIVVSILVFLGLVIGC